MFPKEPNRFRVHWWISTHRTSRRRSDRQYNPRAENTLDNTTYTQANKRNTRGNELRRQKVKRQWHWRVKERDTKHVVAIPLRKNKRHDGKKKEMENARTVYFNARLRPSRVAGCDSTPVRFGFGATLRSPPLGLHPHHRDFYFQFVLPIFSAMFGDFRRDRRTPGAYSNAGQ